MRRAPKRNDRAPKQSPGSLDKLIGLAQQHLANQQYDSVLACCAEIERKCTGHPAASLLAARAEFYKRNFSRAVAILLKLIEANPGQAAIWSDLGLVYQEAKDLTQAENAFRNCLALDPANGLALRNCVDLFIESNRHREAIELMTEFQSHGKLDKGHCRRLAECYKATRQYEEAAHVVEAMLAHFPNDEELYRQLVSVWRSADDHVRFGQALQRWLDFSPENPVAKHLWGIFEHQPGELSGERASDDYVRKVFDGYAETFDQSLQDLEYQTPASVKRMLDDLLYGGALTPPLQNVLDAGCGTGLCGPMLRELSVNLCGVDLSPNMLELARQRAVYDQLVESELTKFLARFDNANDLRFDLIVACDVLNYFGDLRSIFAHVLSCLCVDGLFLFSIESLAEGEDRTYELQPTGRYAHSTMKLTSLLQSTGFSDIESQACILRKQAGQDVQGSLIRAWRRTCRNSENCNTKFT